ncbi:MAG: penicillin-binding protein 2 [Bacillota bacterium]
MDKKEFQRKLTLYFWATFAIFFILAGRLFYVQVVNAAEFQAKSEDNMTRRIAIPARRGDILDSRGEVMATSKPAFSVAVIDPDFKKAEDQINKLAEILNDPEITPEVITEKLRSQLRRYEPVVIKRLPIGDEAMQVITRLEERRQELPGVVIIEEPVRYFPQGGLAGHLLGYVGSINDAELDRYKSYNYAMIDKIGKSGIEKILEVFDLDGRDIGLRGQKGWQQIEVNANNTRVGEKPLIPPTPGNNVVLTIDTKLQRVMEQSMDEVIAALKQNNPKAGAGAAVAIDVQTGAILAMASKPDFYPSDFVDGLKPDRASYYNDPKLQPYTNRAIQGIYAPGSTFKMITAMAALDSGAVTTSSEVYCTGKYWMPGGAKCWQAHGRVNLIRAIQVSCNTYFQNAGYLAGIDRISEVGRQFGLGQKTDAFGLLGEKAGTLPSREWKKNTKDAQVKQIYDRRRAKLEERYDQALAKANSDKQREGLLKAKQSELNQLEAQYRIDYNFETNWQNFDTFYTSMGQGFSQYTVLQLANYVATLANGGQRWRPYLIQKIVSQDGKVLKEFTPQLTEKVKVKPETMAVVRQGMLAVTQPGGTAGYLFANFPAAIKVGAKTGTAQTGLAGDISDSDYFGLFVAFAPYDNPKIAYAGIMEYAPNGGSTAGKVAKAMFEEYFGLNKTYDIQDSDIYPWEAVE